MHPYVLVLIASAVLSGLHAGVVLGRQGPRHSNVIAASLIFTGAVWGFFQAIWNTAPDAETALFYIRLSGIGWLAIAPLALHLHLDLHPGVLPGSRTVLRWIYAMCVALYFCDLFTPWIHSEAVPTPWGYSYRLGWGFPLALVLLLGTVGGAVAMGVRNIGYVSSEAERHQMRWLVAALAIPVAVGTITDGLLPYLDIHTLKLGSVSILALGFTTVWSFQRYGYSIMVPHDFASEILASLPEGIALVHLDGRIRSINRGMGALSGYRPGELEGARLDALIPHVEMQTLLDATTEVQCKLVHQNGAHIPVALSPTRLQDKSGRDIALVILLHDQREIASLRSHLATSGRLAAVGELAAGVAHEINNPLTYVRANLSLLQAHWESLRAGAIKDDRRGEIEDEGDDLIAESLEGVDRAVSIVRDIKGLSHAGRGEPESVDLNPLIESVLRVAGPQLDDAIRVERDLGEIPLVDAIPQELKQVFINLVVNAGQAVGQRGSIRVRTRSVEDRVEIRVEDDGRGMPGEVLERIFDPFFTTKPVGEGTGLGLSISHEIIRRHHGELSVESAVGIGSTFVVRLPARGDEADVLG